MRTKNKTILRYELLIFLNEDDSKEPVRICCFSKDFTGTLEQAKEAAIILAKDFESYSCAVMLDGNEVAYIII